MALPSKLTPNQVLMILRSALGGDVWQQWQLLSLMFDSWPMLRKCAHELSEAVAYVTYKSKPWVDDDGDEPDDDAKERADLVSRSMRYFRPDPFSDEKGFSGMVYNFIDAMFNGIMLEELVWQEVQSKEHGMERLPRAAAWVHPRHFTFSNDGKLAVFNNDYNRLTYPLAGATPKPNPMANKFICAQFMSRSGSALGAGLMRPLAWYWSAVVFNREWMLNTAMKYGAPFLDVAVKGGFTPDELGKLDSMIANAQNLRWMRHPEGATVTMHPAASLGQDNPQVHMMKVADDACMFLLLGQEATTKSTPGKLGGEDAKSKVKRERVEGLAKWVSNDPLQQFARAVIRVNYGDEEKVPTIEADFTEAVDPQAQAATDAVFVSAKIPLVAEEFYKRNNLTMPDQGDIVLVGGQLGKLGSINEEVSASTPPPEPGMGPDGQPFKDADGEDPEPGVKAALKHASDEELMELDHLVQAAHRAPHRNGEVEAVNVAIKQLTNRRR